MGAMLPEPECKVVAGGGECVGEEVGAVDAGWRRRRGRSKRGRGDPGSTCCERRLREKNLFLGPSCTE